MLSVTNSAQEMSAENPSSGRIYDIATPSPLLNVILLHRVLVQSSCLFFNVCPSTQYKLNRQFDGVVSRMDQINYQHLAKVYNNWDRPHQLKINW